MLEHWLDCSGTLQASLETLGTTEVSWWRGTVVSLVRRMNEVNPRRAWLVLG